MPGLSPRGRDLWLEACVVYRILGSPTKHTGVFFGVWSWPNTRLYCSNSRESVCRGDLGSIPALGRSPGEGQYSWLENPVDRGAWQATVHGVTKSQTLLSD